MLHLQNMLPLAAVAVLLCLARSDAQVVDNPSNGPQNFGLQYAGNRDADPCYYQFQSKYSNCCVARATNASGAAIVTAPCNANDPGQFWSWAGSIESVMKNIDAASDPATQDSPGNLVITVNGNAVELQPRHIASLDASQQTQIWNAAGYENPNIAPYFVIFLAGDVASDGRGGGILESESQGPNQCGQSLQFGYFNPNPSGTNVYFIVGSCVKRSDFSLYSVQPEFSASAPAPSEAFIIPDLSY